MNTRISQTILQSLELTGLSVRRSGWKQQVVGQGSPLFAVPASRHAQHPMIGKRRGISCTSVLPSLISTIPSHTLTSIRTLPEIAQVLDSPTRTPNDSIVNGLKRAVDVFQQLSTANKCGEEYKAVLMVQAQMYMDLNQYNKAIQVLDVLIQMDHLTQEEHFDVSLAKAKMLWYSGSFENSENLSKQLCYLAPQMSQHVLMRQGTALNALGLSKLAGVRFQEVQLLENISDSTKQEATYNGSDNNNMMTMMRKAQEATDLLKMASKVLERGYKEKSRSRSLDAQSQVVSMGLACAASYSNQGVAELISLMLRSRGIQMKVPIDSAMNACRDALNILDEMELDHPNLFPKDSSNSYSSETESHNNRTMVRKRIQARVYCNMAWAILFSSEYMHSKHKLSDAAVGIKEESLKLASEYAGNALKLLTPMNHSKEENDETIPHNHDIGRALNLVASCYARAGSAVTAEGLLKSAIDNLQDSTDPLYMIDLRSSYLYYSKLCSNWEKRGADATKYREMAMNINASASLSETWRNQSSIFSGVYMYSMNEL